MMLGWESGSSVCIRRKDEGLRTGDLRRLERY